MPESYHVRLAKEQFVFCSAHFITYDGGVCEPLHGHNYRVAADLHGPLDENHYVVDFIAARDALLAICGELDHRVLLPTEHPAIAVAEQRHQNNDEQRRQDTDEQRRQDAGEQRHKVAGGEVDEVVARFERRRWVFPRQDCVLLPVANTTAEVLARWIGERLEAALRAKGAAGLTELVISVDECDGQQGVWRKTPV